MSLASIYLLVYGLLLLSGAYFGKKAGSQVSMIMGLASGIIVLVCLYINWVLALVVISILLTLIFCKRLLTTKKFMPSGMLLVASVLAIIASLSIR